jgi:hypothetical protein
MVDPKNYPIVSHGRYGIIDQKNLNEITDKTATCEKRNSVSPPPIHT